MAKVICLAQSKGGTSKTSSVLNIAASMAEKGHKVLVIDADQQASLTISLGVDPLQLKNSLYAVLSDPNVAIADILITTKEGIDLVPADVDLAMVEFSIPGAVGREKVLSKKLRPIRNDYDFILIDTPPSFAITTLNAMSAADYLAVPVQPEPLCVHALRQLTQNFEMIQENSNPNLKMLGIFITMYDSRLRGHREIAEQLKQDWGDLCFKTLVRRRSNILESTLEGKSIIAVQRNSDLSQDYQALTKEVLARV
jgi:chromosome partitioning protein